MGGKNPDAPGNKVPAGNVATTRPDAGAPVINSPDAGSAGGGGAQTKEDDDKDYIMGIKSALQPPDPIGTSPMKGIQVTLQNLTRDLQKIQSTLTTYAGAVSSIANDVAAIANAIRNASCDIAKFLKLILQLILDFINDLMNKVLEPIFKITPPTTRPKLLTMMVKALELIVCLMNLIGANLCDAAEKSINDALDRRGGPSAIPPEGYYFPDPICSAEEIVADLLGNNINQIIQTINAGLQPIFVEVNNTLNDYGMGTGSAPAYNSNTTDGISDISIPNIPGVDAAMGLMNTGIEVAGTVDFGGRNFRFLE